jgi:hypothetical protein
VSAAGHHGWRRGLFALATLALALPARAQYQPERVGAGERRWAIGVGTLVEYDDNVNTTQTQKQEGIRSGVTASLMGSMPREQTYFRMRYDFEGSYVTDRNQQSLEQSHAFDGLFSHEFSPRLVLSINDSLRRAVEPDLVDVSAGQGAQLQRRGDYLYNTTALSLNYDLTARWSVALRGSGELWRYDDPVFAFNNDRQNYNAAVDLTHMLTPRTFVGFGYSHGITDYVNPGTNDARNSTADMFYLIFSHVFNPRLSFNTSAGIDLHEFGDGTKDQAPFANLAVNYRYSDRAVASLGFRYGITTTEVGLFRSTETATLFGSASYQVTPRLTAAFNGLYANSTFGNPQPGIIFIGTIPQGEDTYRVSLSLAYQFPRYVNVGLSYTYEEVISDFPGRSFNRNRVTLRVNLQY